MIFDVNFLLLKEHFVGLKDREVKGLYRKYVATEFAYSLRELFASDVVSVPKGLSAVREYRFFSAPAMILYNAIGLLFVDSCSPTLTQLDFKGRQVFSFYPTKFLSSPGGWEVKNDYRIEYKEFSDALKQHIQPGDAVLKMDISGYFETISHSKLAALLRRFAPESTLQKHNISNESPPAIEFYLESLMQRKQGIPQGRKNFVSDYFGYLYLVAFDMEVGRLAKAPCLRWKSFVRYVDDMYLIFSPEPGLSRRRVFKQLLKVEQRVANWLYNEWGLSISPEKTKREIIKSPDIKDEFLKSSKKAVSSPGQDDETPDALEAQRTEIERQFVQFAQVLEKFRIPDTEDFDFELPLNERESLKHVLAKPFQAFLFKKENTERVRTILKQIDFELTAEQINVVIALFYLEQNKDRPFFQILLHFLQNDIDLSDKRHIHIVLACWAQASGPPKIKAQISRAAHKLAADNYGKYLLSLYQPPESIPDNVVYRRICSEHWGKKFKKDVYLFSPITGHERAIQSISAKYPSQETIIQLLKYYVYERWNQRWDVAFNHFQNVFHELCKLRFELADNATLADVTMSLKTVGIEDELLVMQFYDRRNFNAISHPSQKGKPSVKVTREDLEHYEPKILRLITDHILTT